MVFKIVMDKQDRQRFFQQIIEQHRGILFKVARTYCPNDDDRQDLIQEIMIQIWRSLDRYDDTYKLSTWLYRISLNVAISLYRKNSVRVRTYAPLTEQTVQISANDPSDNERQLKQLERFISELKEIDKALMLLYLEGKSHAEIADVLGITVSNVGTKIGRIKLQLRKRFSEQKQE
jgi:RNA polymerase sigma factor (sigma-70 family)